MKPTKTDVLQWLHTLNNDKLIHVFNEYADDRYDEPIEYFNDPDYFFDSMFSKPADAARAVYSGHVSYNDDFVIFDGYGNLQTFSDPARYLESRGLLDDLAEAIAEDPDAYGYPTKGGD